MNFSKNSFMGIQQKSPSESMKLNVIYVANFISSIGSFIQILILPLWVYHISNSQELTTITLFFEYLFIIFGTILFGPIIDRANIKGLYVSGELIKGLLVLSLYFFGEYYSYVILVIALTSLLNAINQPLVQVLIKNYTQPNLISSQTAIFSTLMGLSLIIGPSIGGFIVSYLGMKFGFVINAMTFFIASLAYPFVSNDIGNKSNSSYIKDIISGFKYTLYNANIFNCCLQQFILWCFYGGVQILVPLMIIKSQYSEVRSTYIGYSMGAVGIGFLIGAILSRKLLKNIINIKEVKVYCCVSMAIISILMYALSCSENHIIMMIISLGIIGLLLSFFNILNKSIIISVSESKYIGRVSSNHRLTMLVGICVSSLMTSFLSKFNLTPVEILSSYGVSMLVITLFLIIQKR